MHEAEIFLVFTRRLDGLSLRYMVTGSVASIVYGEPRLTHDIDIVLELDRPRIGAFAGAFPLEEFYCPPEEVLAVETGRAHRGHFNLIHHESGYKADVYLIGSDAFHAWAMERRRQVSLGPDRSLWLAPPEYVIVRKLQFYREGGSDKHLRDIRGMLEASGEIIDRGAVEDWAQRLGVTEQWLSVSVD
jgi:hypothetical protein